MNKFLYIILICFFTFTIISCSSSDDGATTTTDNTTPTDTTTIASEQTFVDSNFCRITKNTSRSNSSLIVNDRRSDSRSSGRTGRVMYVDKSSQSKYKTDNYLLIDPFDSNSVMCERTGTVICDRVDLSDAAPILGNQFTQEARFYYDDGGDGRGQLMGSESFRAPSIGFQNHGKEIRYGFYTDGAVTGYPGRATNLNTQKAWHHVATTFDGTNYKLFLDGVEIDNTTAFQGLTPPDTEPVRIIGNKPWVGKIDEVRMWSVARTQAEIQANMNKTLVGNETGLVAYYPMDVNNNWEIIDKTENANHVKITDAEILSRFISDNSSCTNGPDGTTSCPFPTIRSALDNVTGGDHIYIRQGRYTELLNKWQLNRSYETEGPKIVIEAYPNEEVIIDGTVALNDNNSKWEQYSHQLDNGTSISIYKTVIDFDNISKEIRTPIRSIYQLFVNDRYMIPAMPMNFKNPTDPTTGNPKNPEPNTIWSLSQRTEEAAIVEVDDEDTIDEENIDNSTLYDNATLELLSITPSGRPSSKGGPYVPGSLEFFDGVEEWAFDNNTKTLYLYASDNFTPNSTNVRVRVRDRLVNIRNSENITFKNIDFFAGSITIRGTKHFTLENCRFSFNSDMGLLGNSIEYSPISTVRNCIFEYINDGHSWSQQLSSHPVLENVLFRYNDWFGGTAWSPTTDRNYRGDSMSHAEAQGDQSWYGTQWRYITIENSYTAGIFAGPRSLVEYARFENLYEGCDCSVIQRNAAGARYSTTRFTWIINAPALNGMRFDSKCGARFGDVHNVVSIGNRRGFRLKGDFHDVYHVNAYDNRRQDITLSVDKYCGPDIAGGREKGEPGNWNSNVHNALVGGSFQCFSEDCWAEGTDPMTNKTGVFNPSFDFPHLDSVGIWFGRQLSGQGSGWSSPKKELAKPWIQMRSLPESKLLEKFGANPWNVPAQDYDFRPKKGSYLIDSGVIIPGINDGKDTGVPHPEDGIDFNHTPLYSGQKRKFVGEAPDIGAYEYGDSVYWIPGFRYPHPSVPIPNDGAVDVPIDYSLVWNYPYKKDYSNTKASVKVSGPGVNLTKEFKYPHNVFFQAFEPGGTYNWSVTVDNVSGGNWSFKVDDKIYPLNDRSVDTTDKKSLLPYQINNLEVSQNKIAFLLFDIPSSINGNHKIKLNLVPESVVSLNGEIEIYKYDYKGWGEKTDKKNIGIIDQSLGTKLATLTSLENGTAVSVDLTDQIYSYGEEFSIALKVSDPSDKVYFYSKEKLLTDGKHSYGVNYGKGYAPQKNVWPNISFQ